MPNFVETTVKPGSGGPKLVADTFTNPGTGNTDTICYSALAFGTLGAGSYQAVDGSHGFPVNIVAGTITIGVGSALVGQVEISDGTNVLGTSSHPVRTDPTGTTTQPVAWASPQHVIVDSGSITATVSGTVPVNSSQIAGTPTSAAEGASDAGTQRVALGTDDNFSTDSRWSTADTNLHTVKSAAGRVFRIEVMNTGSGAAYLRLYNKASNPAPASDTPVRRYTIPGNTAGAGFVMEYLKGRYFSTGIAYDITGAAGDNDTTALAANQCVINVDYK